MGVIISKSTYPPFALVTGIIGIISFIFTLGTFLRVVWENLMTIFEAPHQVHGYLTNLRTELLEEKASIRLMRKQSRKWQKRFSSSQNNLVGIELDEVTLKTMGDVMKNLVKRFRDLERPFLEDGERGIEDWKDHRRRARRRDSEMDGGSPFYENHSPNEKGRMRRSSRDNRDDQDDNDDAFWAQRTQYAKLNFSRRLIWLRKKSEAQTLAETLSRVQIRRIARQVGGISMLVHEYGQCSLGLEEMVRRIDERTSRIVGIRRVE